MTNFSVIFWVTHIPLRVYQINCTLGVVLQVCLDLCGPDFLALTTEFQSVK